MYLAAVRLVLIIIIIDHVATQYIQQYAQRPDRGAFPCICKLFPWAQYSEHVARYCKQPTCMALLKIALLRLLHIFPFRFPFPCVSCHTCSIRLQITCDTTVHSRVSAHWALVRREDGFLFWRMNVKQAAAP